MTEESEIPYGRSRLHRNLVARHMGHLPPARHSNAVGLTEDRETRGKYIFRKVMPMTSALLQLTSHQNVRVVRIPPKVKSAKTCKLFNVGAVKLHGSAKSADPIVYNARVGWETSATGCLKRWR